MSTIADIRDLAESQHRLQEVTEPRELHPPQCGDYVLWNDGQVSQLHTVCVTFTTTDGREFNRPDGVQGTPRFFSANPYDGGKL